MFSVIQPLALFYLTYYHIQINVSILNLEIKKLPKSRLEISGEIPAEDFERAWQDALKEFNEKANFPGFRPGHVPQNILIEKVGERAITERAAELTLGRAYPEIINKNKIEAIGHPQITITKIARKNPLGFKAATAVLPEISLPDYHSIAKEKMTEQEEIVVSEQEMDESIEYLRKTKSKQSTVSGEQSKANSQRSAGILGADGQPIKTENENVKSDTRVPDPAELNDNFAKTVGFNTVSELRDAIRSNILIDKETRAKETRRMAALDAISKKTGIEIPDILVESEKNKMLEELKSSILRFGLKWEDYLAHIKKTEEELLDDWNEDAQKRSRYGLVLREIADKEKLEPSEAELEEYAAQIVSREPESERSKIDKARLKDYAYGILRNEKVFQMLEQA